MGPSKTVSKPERRRRIFLTARTIFVGANAQIRDRKNIGTVIASHEEAFGPLNAAFGKIIVADVIASLLEAKVFESELKAKLTFPELYQVSAARRLQHDVSIQNAASSEAEAMESMSQRHLTAKHEDVDGAHNEYPADDRTNEAMPQLSSPDIPSLYPSYLTYEVQHKLLNTVQSLLEKSCYDWAKYWLPALVKEKKWACAEAVELSQWGKTLPEHFHEISDCATSVDSRESLERILLEIHPLRHAAVHRLATSAKGIEKMLNSALNLVKALHDTSAMFKLEAVIISFKSRVEDMELRKNQLENELDDELRSIQEQRAVLNRREEEVKASTVQQDAENERELSLLFAKSLGDLNIQDPADPKGHSVVRVPDIEGDDEDDEDGDNDASSNTATQDISEASKAASSEGAVDQTESVDKPLKVAAYAKMTRKEENEWYARLKSGSIY